MECSRGDGYRGVPAERQSREGEELVFGGLEHERVVELVRESERPVTVGDVEFREEYVAVLVRAE